MKPTRHILLTIAMLLCSITASAHDFEVEGIYYNITSSSDLTVAVTYRGNSYSQYSNEYSGTITIPATVTHNGVAYSVKSIGDYAFYYCRNLTAITIPEGVTSIGSYAFDGCSSLTSITLPEGVTSIGYGAFRDCSSLTSITIPENSKLTSFGGSAFNGCSNLTAVHISSIEAWCEISFYDNESNPLYYAHNLYLDGELVTNLVIPEGVTSIESVAFRSCSSLKSITLPESVTSIGVRAFNGCSSLTAITIPENSKLTSIGDYAFRDCSSLTAITIPESVTSIGDAAFYLCSSLTSITIPENSQLTSIGSGAFQYCSSLTSITIPEGVTSIGNYAFSDCSSLTVITIPESVTSIGDAAFNGTAWYDNQPDGVIYAGKVLYKYKGTMPANTSVEVKEGTVSIGNYAFSGCSNITSITLPESVTSIGWYAFYNCSSLTSITCYAKTPPSCGSYVFGNVYKQTPVYVPATSKTKYWYAAEWKDFTNFQDIVAVTGIILSQSSVMLFEGETLQLTAEIAPESAFDLSLTWSSSDANVATVDASGKVMTLAAGVAIITATANDGSGVSASCEVTVKVKPEDKCAAPVISYVDGQVVLTCETEGVTFVSETTASGIAQRQVATFDLTATYTITAYATKEDYLNSEATTVTLCWIDCSGQHEGDSEETDIITIPAKPVLIQTDGGTITVNGLAEGTVVKVNDLNGVELGTAIATGGTATITTGLTTGSVAVVQIGERSVKVAIK